MVPNENNCWIIGDQNSNPSLFFPPSTTGIPFTPDNATKRAVVESGSIGSPGGTIGFAGAVAEPVPGSGSCDARCVCLAFYLRASAEWSLVSQPRRHSYPLRCLPVR